MALWLLCLFMVEMTKPRKKHPRKPLAEITLKERGWMVVGFDTSPSSLAGAAIAYDRTLNKLKGPKFVMRRWGKDDHYFTRLKDSAKAHELILDLMASLGVMLTLDEIFICQEKAWPAGMGRRALDCALERAQATG
jgi:hypothetical protein